MFKRREPEPVDLWGPEFNERRVPVGPDPVELERLIARLYALIELRADYPQQQPANDIVALMDAEIAAALTSPTKHRDWKETRPKVLQLLTELGMVLYQQHPEPTD